MTREEYKQLLILNMKRCIEIMESMPESERYFFSDDSGELKNKFREIRRDSVKFVRNPL